MRGSKHGTRNTLKFLFQIALILVFLSGSYSTSPARPVEARSVDPAPPLIPPNAPLFAPPTDPTATVTLGGLGDVMIGSDFIFTVTFDNDPNDPPTGAEVGYGPFIDLIFPATGVDGDPNALPPEPFDGVTFVSADYLGITFTAPDTLSVQTFPNDVSGIGCRDHAWAVDGTGTPLQVCGPSGDRLVSLRLPFGSFAPDQPPAVVTVNATLSQDADAGTPLDILARGGYMFGWVNPLDDWCCGDPGFAIPGTTDGTGWPSGSVTPTILSITKTYNGPANTQAETATGPNFPHQYTLTVDIADGQTIAPLDVIDILDDNVQYIGIAAGTTAGYSIISEPDNVPPPTPGGTLDLQYASVTGTTATNEVVVVVDFYIPLLDSGSVNVIEPTNGDDVDSENIAYAGGIWTPHDTRDTGSTISTDATCPTCPPLHTLQDKSIAIQKGVGFAPSGDIAPLGTYNPGDILQYTLTVQVSDFFAFGGDFTGLQTPADPTDDDGIVITDVVSDGQHFDASFTPELSVNGNPYTLPNLAFPNPDFAPANFTIAPNYTPADPAPNDGTTTLLFRVSNEIRDRGENGNMVGGCVNPGGGLVSPCDPANLGNGPTTATIVFRTVILDEFTDDHLLPGRSGDESVDQGDVLENDATILGFVLDNSTFAVGQPEDDDATAGLSIDTGSLVKEIYAIKDSAAPAHAPGPSPVSVKPGDEVTYRITYTMPTGDEENLRLSDYLPLPVFHVDDPEETGGSGWVWTFNPIESTGVSDVPLPGEAMFGDQDDFYAYSGLAPGVTSDVTNNRLMFDYGDFDGPTEAEYVADIIFTVTVSDDPFADGLYLTNEAHAYEGSTNAAEVSANAIVQVILTEPVLVSGKGVVASSNSNDIYSPDPPAPQAFNAPGTAGARWVGVIDSSDNPITSINSNISGVDAGDLVTFALVIENLGSSGKGAFDITISDDLPAGFEIPVPPGNPAGLNLRISYGDSTQLALSYTRPDNSPATGSDLFGTGIRIVDPDPDNGACQAHSLSSGMNIIIITFDLRVVDSIPPGVITNMGSLTYYAGEEGGPNHLPEDQEDEATSTVVTTLNKSLVGTEIVNGTNANNEAVIGEFVTYRMVATIPEGEIPNLQLVDTLDGGMAFVDVTSFTVSDLDLDLGLPFDTGIYYAGSPLPITPTIGVGGQSITFNFGDTTNTDRDNTVAERITIEYRAVVLNLVGNQGAGSPGAATLLNNRARSVWTGGNTAFVSAANVTVIESAVTTTKTALPLTADAGDPITFTITLENTGETDAWDLTWTDTVPAGLNYQGSLAFIPGCPATATSVDDSLAPVLSASLSDLGFGISCQVTFDVIVDNSVAPLQVITNTATTYWTSLEADNVTDRSTHNTASDERTGAGGVDNYFNSGSVDVTVNNTAITKQITATSDTSTTGDVVVVGEEVTYVLLIAFPEGFTALDTVVDNLPAGLEMVPATSEVITTAAASGGLLTADFSGTMDAPTIGEVLGTPGSVTFGFTNVSVPADNITTNNSLMMRFRAQVTNAAATINDGRITNEATNQVGAAAPVTSNQVDVWLRTLGKSVTSSRLPSAPPHDTPTTTLPDVTIGEIVTYELQLTLPPNSSDTASIIDTMDTGLAFVSCSEISRSDTTVTGSNVGVWGPGNCSGAPLLAVSSTNASPENQGNVVTFNLGTIINNSGSPETITVTYEVIVLDIASNVQNVTLDNSVVWTGSHGTLARQTSPSLRIVTPTLQIVKTVSPEVAILGSTVSYSIDISHTFDSLATAYDVLLTDGIPTGLVLDQASVAVTASAGLPVEVITTNPTQFSVYWEYFPLGESATVTFQAVFIGPPPVSNSAFTEWKTIQIDPRPYVGTLPPTAAAIVAQSAFNTLSTERRFNPLDASGVNNYQVTSSARIDIPRKLPSTGFAPGRVTELPVQPDRLAYKAFGDLWLEIPKLGVKKDIVGVPFGEEKWNLTWLGSSAGYLDGTAYPTHAGNSGLTAHAYLADGTPGPFVDLDKLGYGDQVIVHLGGQKYIYQVQENRRVRPDSVESVLRHEDLPWLTLITCKNYNDYLKDYTYRIAVRALLVQVLPE